MHEKKTYFLLLPADQKVVILKNWFLSLIILRFIKSYCNADHCINKNKKVCFPASSSAVLLASFYLKALQKYHL